MYFTRISYIALPLSEKNESVNEVPSVDKIVGGRNTTIETHPYQLSLRVNQTHVCGGSILTPTRGLSAGHCVGLPPSYPVSVLNIMAGSTLRLGDGNQQIRPLNRTLRHPDYSGTTNAINDVALLYWEQPLKFGANVQAIALPPQSSPAPYGKNANVTGWGNLIEGGQPSDVLQVVILPLISNEECNRIYNPLNYSVSPDMLCAGLSKDGGGTCNADSGSPLTVSGFQLGVVSWSHGCARPGLASVYARVAFFANWIRDNL